MPSSTYHAILDRILRAVAELYIPNAPVPPATAALAAIRQRVMVDVQRRHVERAIALEAARAAGDASAGAELAALAETALAEMREQVRQEARRAGGLAHLLAEADHRWADCHEMEHMDDPDIDPELRSRLVAQLNNFNVLVRSYDLFYDAMLPLLRPDGPTRVLELAAGVGGFALFVAARAQREGTPLEITASDLKAEYVEVGAREAQQAGLPVDFVVQDALDLSNLDPGQYDIVITTQAVHHFGPGPLALMVSSAARLAGRGVLLLDGSRSALTLSLFLLSESMRFGHPYFLHDAVVSFRRFFVSEELGLIAKLSRWAGCVDHRFLPPGFCMARLQHV